MTIGLEKRCRGEFTAGDRRRGTHYHAAGRCRLVSTTPDGVAALVAGTGGARYAVTVDWSEAGDGFVLAACECPRFAGGYPCKHLWATLLAADRAGSTSRLAGRGPLAVVAAGGSEVPDEAWDPEEELEELFRLLEPASGSQRYSGPSRRAAEPEWRRRLAELRRPGSDAAAADDGPEGKPAEVWYRFDPDASRGAGRVVVELFQRQRLKDGRPGAFKSLTVPADGLDRFSQRDDREILGLLLATTRDNRYDYLATPSYYSSGVWHGERGGPRLRRGELPAVLNEILLPRLCATGRFGWDDGGGGGPVARPLSWDGGDAWKLVLRLDVEAGGAGAVSLGGELRRGNEARRLDEPLLLLAAGVVFFPDTVARLDTGREFSWVGALRSAGPMRVPPGDLERFLGELFELPRLPELELSPELGIAESRPEPGRRIVFSSPGSGAVDAPLVAEPWFDYDGRAVPAMGGPARLYDAAARGLLWRHPESERRALSELEELPFRRAEGALELAPSAFESTLAALLQRGWEVEIDGGPLRRAGVFTARVTSGTDWFDLHGEMEFEGGSVALPELLRALRRGDRVVRLADGGRGLLPAEWIVRYTPLAELGFEESGGGLRLLPAQTLLLDALLAATDFEADRRFAELRDRLRSFTGIEPAAAPRGFRGELRGYQRQGLGWLGCIAELGIGGCLADDMGLGKTIQVLALLQAARVGPPPEGGRRPSIVVVPRSLLFNWLDEAARFTPRLRLVDYTGPGRAGLRRRFGSFDVVVTTYGTLRRDVAALRETAFDYAVLDEAQAIKNAGSQSAKACRLLNARHRLALTGTPVENHLGELWSLFEFLNPGMLGRLPRLRGLAGTRTLDTRAAVETVSRALRPFILRRTKQQVLTELPEKTEQTLHCTLDRRQRKLYNELRDHYRALLTRRIEQLGIGRSRIQVLEALLRLRQAACHPGLLDPERGEAPSAKLETLVEQLAEVIGEGHKALVFSQFTGFLAIVRRRLERAGVVYEYLDGRVRNRKQRVERFQTDDACPVFLISLKAGGLGLNLTAADYVFILDPWWNPAVEAQAIDRAHRLGQPRPVFAYRLIARDTVEEKILGLQESKRELADAILADRKGVAAELTAEDLEYLLG